MNQVIKEAYRVVVEGGEGEIVEKKSRFIATVRAVESEEEAVAFIDSMKKKYWDARHNCSAFVIGSRAELTRCSDDGEPSGTAGRPMLEVLLQEKLCNVAVVVTRYFGGTLLGTGGLVRAYTQAVKAGIEASKVSSMKFGSKLNITTDYNGIGKILYLLGELQIEPENSEYGEDVKLTILVGEEATAKLCKDITEATNGKAQIEEVEKLYYLAAD